MGQILDDLGFTQMPRDDVWPRVWWVASGLLNSLPIHAAGYHDDPSGKSVMDRVISSYTSTIKSLAYSLHRAQRLGDSADVKALLIGMPKTPNLPNGDLPFVEKELQLIGEELRKLPVIEATMIKNPNKEQVLRDLSTHQAIHFACHGSSAADPSKSMLLVDDWESLPLTVADITLSKIEHGQFAYLSACNTSRGKEASLLDESINLVSAIQLAGYPSVVGTLWQVVDKHSSQVAKDVYMWMVRDGRKFKFDSAAEGLHRAVKALRSETRMIPGFKKAFQTDPIAWAPYIHVGI